jgi:translation initiation factor IF-3
VIGEDGSQVGILKTQDALARAQDADLDLVEVAPQASPPVCKIMDYGKFKYQESVRAKEARRKHSQVTVKEIKFRPKISTHDYDTKKGHVERFLNGGHRVKVTVMFRGREMHHTELGQKLLTRLSEDLSEIATVETASRLDGRNMTMMFAPQRRKQAG